MKDIYLNAWQILLRKANGRRPDVIVRMDDRREVGYVTDFGKDIVNMVIRPHERGVVGSAPIIEERIYKALKGIGVNVYPLKGSENVDITDDMCLHRVIKYNSGKVTKLSGLQDKSMSLYDYIIGYMISAALCEPSSQISLYVGSNPGERVDMMTFAAYISDGRVDVYVGAEAGNCVAERSQV